MALLITLSLWLYEKTPWGIRAAVERATLRKVLAMDELTATTRAILGHGEDAVDSGGDLLKTLSWAGRKADAALEAPGQCRNLEAPRQGEGWVFLDWKAPLDGGPVRSYRLEVRERPAGDWAIVGVAGNQDGRRRNREGPIFSRPARRVEYPVPKICPQNM